MLLAAAVVVLLVADSVEGALPAAVSVDEAVEEERLVVGPSVEAVEAHLVAEAVDVVLLADVDEATRGLSGFCGHYYGVSAQDTTGLYDN